jgi:hypothetical protein
MFHVEHGDGARDYELSRLEACFIKLFCDRNYFNTVVG